MYLNSLVHNSCIEDAATAVARKVWLRVHEDAVIGLPIIDALWWDAVLWQCSVALVQGVITEDAGRDKVRQTAYPFCPNIFVIHFPANQEEQRHLCTNMQTIRL